MTNDIEIVNAAVTLIIKAAILAARFSGRARKRSLKRLSKMDIRALSYFRLRQCSILAVYIRSFLPKISIPSFLNYRLCFIVYKEAEGQ